MCKVGGSLGFGSPFDVSSIGSSGSSGGGGGGVLPAAPMPAGDSLSLSPEAMSALGG
ncbi:MAG: hypothetical protein AB1758_37910 [Candidatus Eremiobacterota bacterium]